MVDSKSQLWAQISGNKLNRFECLMRNFTAKIYRLKHLTYWESLKYIKVWLNQWNAYHFHNFHTPRFKSSNWPIYIICCFSKSFISLNFQVQFIVHKNSQVFGRSNFLYKILIVLSLYYEVLTSNTGSCL